jgi:hypothetical protein
MDINKHVALLDPEIILAQQAIGSGRSDIETAIHMREFLEPLIEFRLLKVPNPQGRPDKSDYIIHIVSKCTCAGKPLPPHRYYTITHDQFKYYYAMIITEIYKSKPHTGFWRERETQRKTDARRSRTYNILDTSPLRHCLTNYSKERLDAMLILMQGEMMFQGDT